MATANQGNTPALNLYNATTRTAYKRVDIGGFYHVGDKVYIGDLYTDIQGKGDPVLMIQREAPIKELPAPEITPVVKPVVGSAT